MNIPLAPSELRVAFPSNATAQQTLVVSATGRATTAQLKAIKYASLLDLGRNKVRNKDATHAEKGAQLDTQNKEVVVAHSKQTSLIPPLWESVGLY
jgi:hypothetical protein